VRVPLAPSDIALHMAFAIWAQALGRVPRTFEIEARFDVHRNTASKWRREFLALRTPTHPLHRLAATGSATPSQEERIP
jgi:hypothetical protein